MLPFAALSSYYILDHLCKFKGRTDTQTHRQTDLLSLIYLYRYTTHEQTQREFLHLYNQIISLKCYAYFVFLQKT